MTKRQAKPTNKKKYVSDFPKLVDEWHPIKNGNKRPEDYLYGSNESVWWKCPVADDHEWKVEIYSRTKPKGSGCGFCSGRKASSTYNLQLTHPEISKEWHPTQNGDLKPENFTKGSHEIIQWQCKKVINHIYPMAIYNKVQGKNCSYCSGQKVHENNSFASNYPELSIEWHPTKNGKNLPHHFTKSSNEIVWWQCKKAEDHSWDASIKNRTTGEQNCPFCSGKRVCNSNSVATLYPELIEEFHPTKNGEKKLESFTFKSNEYLWWKCFKGHEWSAPISSRTSGNNCEICNPRTSKPEIRILTELKYLFDDCTWRKKIKGKELDVYISSLNIGIEYDGYWHKNQKNIDNDLSKNKHFNDLGVNLIRVRGDKLDRLTPGDLLTSNPTLKKEDIDLILQKIRSICDSEYYDRIDSYLKSKKFLNEAEYFTMVTDMMFPASGKSFACKYPNVAKYWDYKKNYPSCPEQYYPNSNDKVYWRCVKGTDHRWSATITNMKRKRKGNEYCPFCNGRRASKNYNLTNSFPDVAKQWHPTENKNIKPENVTKGSDKKYYWLINGKKVHRSVANNVAAYKRKIKNI